MAELVKLELVTPQKRVASLEAQFVVVPGEDGDFGVLSGHATLLSTLRAGVLTLFNDDQAVARYVVGHGFGEVLGDRVTILADVAEDRADIDPEAAASALREAEEAIVGRNEDDPEYAALRRRLEIAQARADILAD